MRRPSRLLPKIRRERMPLLGWALLAALVAGIAYALWRQPLLTGGLLLLIFGLSVAHALLLRLHLRRLAAVRAGEDIGAFVKQFDYRNVDTWVIRAVYEELQEYLRSEVSAFPLRASDRLAEDLKVDQGDLEDVVASRVAERTGRSHDAATANPLYGKVRGG